MAFPFLAGTRPSEQLGLLWEDVDFEANVIRIRRMQERDGTICELTKTIAGTRDIPICSLLRTMLLEWRVACPRHNGELHRVFPGPGQQQAWPLPRIGGGGPLQYNNFRNRVWKPTLQRLGLPPVTPHSARHSFISTLQAQGVEIGLVAKLAGHANANVRLAITPRPSEGASKRLRPWSGHIRPIRVEHRENSLGHGNISEAVDGRLGHYPSVFRRTCAGRHSQNPGIAGRVVDSWRAPPFFACHKVKK